MSANIILNGREMFSPVTTDATGHLSLSRSKHGLLYKLEVARIHQPTGATLRLGIRGHAGPIVVVFPIAPITTHGVLSEGVIDDKMLTGCLEGHSVTTLVNEIDRGHVFIVVATDKHSRGEIRGQVEFSRPRRTLSPKRPSAPKKQIPQPAPVDNDKSFSSRLNDIATKDPFDAGKQYDPTEAPPSKKGKPSQYSPDDFDMEEFKRSIGL